MWRIGYIEASSAADQLVKREGVIVELEIRRGDVAVGQEEFGEGAAELGLLLHLVEIHYYLIINMEAKQYKILS
jgi:hypothetical protein